MKIRPTKSNDIPSLEQVLDGTELFPSDMLTGMLNDFLSDQTGNEIWLTCEINGKPIGLCYAMEEQLAQGTWNMLAIAVQPSLQGKGAGKTLISELESCLRELGNRVLIADTSGKNEYSRTREFYRNNGYIEEARIRDFWAAGDDKVVFWKSL